MRRKDRHVTDETKIRDIISRCNCCRLGMWDGKEVYIVPLSFGYEYRDDKHIFYFHSAKVGRKIDILTKNPMVCFEMDTDYQLNGGELACDYSCRFQSIIGKGKVEELAAMCANGVADTVIFDDVPAEARQ